MAGEEGQKESKGNKATLLSSSRRIVLALGTLCLLFFILFILMLVMFLVQSSRSSCSGFSAAGVTLTKSSFGKTKDGKAVEKFTFSNENEMSYSVITFGAIIHEIKVPDKQGRTDDVNLGYDDQKGYDNNVPYFGAIIGRVVNRIADGKFTLDGVNYTVPINNEGNSLHGGIKAFDKRIWESTQDGNRLILKLVSEDGDEGYPGQLTVYVTYELSNQNEIIIKMNATSTKPTPINMANHAYFNLAGQAAGAIYDHVITISANKFLPSTKDLLPTGEIKSVEGTPFDLRKPTRIGDVISTLPVTGGGFDTNYCLVGTTGKKYTARVEEPKSGRVLEVYTNQPAVQLYTGNFLQGTVGKGGITYQKHGAFCLETQTYPNAINHQDTFPDCVLRPGSTYEHLAVYKFSVKK